MKMTSLLVAFLLIAEAVFAVEPAPQRRTRTRTPSHYRLVGAKEDKPNGLRAVLRNELTLLVEERASQPLVAVVSSVARASGEAALAGSQELIRRVLAEKKTRQRILQEGGLLEIVEALDRSHFVSLGPSENVEAILRVHRDLLQPPKLASLEGTVPPAEVAELKAAFTQRFRPANVIVSVSGAVLREDVLRWVAESYSALRPGARLAGTSAAAEGFQDSGFHYVQSRTGADRHLLQFEFDVPGSRHRDSAALLVLARVLAGGQGSLLHRTLQREGSVLSARVILDETPSGSHLRMNILAAGEKIDSAEVGLLALLASLAETSLDAAELNRAKALLATEFLLQRQDLASRARLRAESEARQKRFDIDRLPKRILSVEAGDLKRVAKQYLKISNLRLTESLPQRSEERNFTAETLRETIELLLPAETSRLREEILTRQRGDSQQTFELADFTPKLSDNTLKRTSVLRGPAIFLEESHLQPLVHVGLFLPGGRIDETAQNAGITELMLRSLVSSAGGGPDSGFWARLEAMGASPEVINEEDFFGLRFAVHAARLEPFLGELLPWWREASLLSDRIEQEKLGLLADIQLHAQNPEVRSLDGIRESIFQTHPYGRSRLGSPGAVAGLTGDAVKDWVTQQVAGYHPLLLFLGDVDGTSFLPPLIPMLSQSKLRQKEPGEKPVAEVSNYAAVALQDLVLLGVPGPALGTRDDWQADLLESLVMQWEDRLPAVDGQPPQERVRLDHFAGTNGGLVWASVRDSSAQPDEIQKRLVAQLKNLPGAMIKPVDFKNSQVLAITRFYQARELSQLRLIRLARNLIAGEQPEFEREYLTTLKGIQPEGIRSLTERLFQELPGRRTSSSSDGVNDESSDHGGRPGDPVLAGQPRKSP